MEAEGLTGGLRELAARTSEVFRIQCELHCPSAIPESDVAVDTHLYRIVQEAVTNAIKHGKARQIDIELATEAGVITLKVKDDGVGLPAESPRAPGMGLRIMQYRAGMIGGTVVVERHSRGGTAVTCTAPLGKHSPASSATV